MLHQTALDFRVDIAMRQGTLKLVLFAADNESFQHGKGSKKSARCLEFLYRLWFFFWSSAFGSLSYQDDDDDEDDDDGDDGDEDESQAAVGEFVDSFN